MADTILSTASAGQVIAQDNAGGVQNPAQPASVLTADGRINATNVESGTNAPVVTIVNSQSTGPGVTYTAVDPGVSAQLKAQNAAANPVATGSTFVKDPAYEGGGYFAPVYATSQLNQDPTGTTNATAAPPTTAPGVGAGTGSQGADAATPTKNSTQTAVDNAFGNGPIIPQPNVLDKYSSYTYQASIYLMTPAAMAQLVKTKKKSLAGSQLIIQSGGAPVTGRNPYFSNDYYIDRIELKSTIMGKGTGSAHNVNGIKMTIVEPNGITFLENLDKAVTGYLGTATDTKKKSFQSQLYLLVIRFYGYDANGKIVQAGAGTQGAIDNTTTPGAAFVEKYYPFNLNSVKFKIQNKAVEYDIEATACQYQIGLGQIRGGVIPYNVELSATTVQDALLGPAVVSATANNNATTNGRDTTTTTDTGVTGTSTAPQNASAAPTNKLTVRQGLVTALNQYQKDLVNNGTYTYPDVYSVEFTLPAISQAKIKRVDQDKTKDPPPQGGTAKEQLSPTATSVDPTTRTLTITAGQQIVQVIDQIVKNSTYIEDQQKLVIGEASQTQKTNAKATASNLAWYKISIEATPGKYDPKRNDYAYNIKYIVHPYKISNMISAYFDPIKYNGVHKQYNYWFTGENSQIISYEQTYNALYAQILSGGPPSPTQTAADNVKLTFAPRSGQSSQGAKGRTNEPAANAADYLYSPGDNQNCTMTIVGDPAWLQQGEAALGTGSTGFEYKPFLPDGTINVDSQQVLFEVLFNVPGDYNLNTGLMDPNSTNNTTNTTQASLQVPGQSRRSLVYQANECTSEFARGKFTQTVKGSFVNYYPNQGVKSSLTGRPTANATAATNGTPSTNSRPTNSSTGPNGTNSIPTLQPSATPADTTANPLPPNAGTSNSIELSPDGTVIQYPPNPYAPTTNGSPPSVLPALTPPPPVTSDGQIQVIASDQRIPSTIPIYSASSVNQLNPTETGSILAPSKLPSADLSAQYEAKLDRLGAAQVNTTPPQDIVKEA